MSLACGGRGPCCHIGYAHRHCEHCDAVIALSYSHQHWYGGWQPHWAGYYPGVYYGNTNTMLAQQMNTLAASQLTNSLQALNNQFNQLEEPKK